MKYSYFPWCCVNLSVQVGAACCCRADMFLLLTLTSCVRSQPSLRPAAAMPDCLAMQSRWGEQLNHWVTLVMSLLVTETHQNQPLLSEYTSRLLFVHLTVSWTKCAFVCMKAGVWMFIQMFVCSLKLHRGLSVCLCSVCKVQWWLLLDKNNVLTFLTA